jgi:uncharacterized protein YggE
MSDSQPQIQTKLNLIPYIKPTYIILLITLMVVIVGSFGMKSVESIISKPVVTDQSAYFRVNGQATKYVKPDSAQISFSAEVTGTDVRDVQKKASEAVNNALEAIKKTGVKENEIKTSNYDITPNYDFTNSTRTLKGYTAKISLTVKTKLLDKVGTIIDSATGAGINVVSGLSFYIEDYEKIRNEIKLDAIKNAKSDAAKLAEEAGLSLGSLKNVEDSYIGYPIYQSYATDAVKSLEVAAPSSNPISLNTNPGEQEVVVNVVLVYEVN